jgi:predicted porin
LDAGYKAYETTTVAGVSTKSDQISNNAFTTSRLGVMGTEDLGGGLKAGFTIEGNFAIAPGTTSSDSATAFNFGRQQFLTLSSASAGTLLVGKTDAIVKQVFDSYDAGYSNNLVGAYDGFGTGSDFASATSNPANIIGNQRDVVARYTSPKFSGFDVTVGLLKQSSDSKTAAAATETGSGYELGSTYAAGKLALSAGYRSADTKTNGTTAITTAVNAVCATGSSNLGATVCIDGNNNATTPTTAAKVLTGGIAAVDSTTNSIALGASYNFGPVVGYAQYFDQDVKNNTAGTKVAEDAMAVGVRVPMGKSTLFASYTEGEQKSATNVKTDFSGMQLGVKYDLSKRTYGYVAYGEAEKQQVGKAKAKADNLAFGVAHSF